MRKKLQIMFRILLMKIEDIFNANNQKPIDENRRHL